MSELNTNVMMTVQAGPVANTPIDSTLSIAGNAADAKAVGDALEAKVDISSIMETVRITFDGIESDNQGIILAYGDDIPIDNGNGAKSIKETIEDVDSKTGTDIAASNTDSTSIAQKLTMIEGKQYGDQMTMSSIDMTTVADAITEVASRTASDIPFGVSTIESVVSVIDARVAGVESDYLSKNAQDLTVAQKTAVRGNLGLGSSATREIANNLTTTEDGYALDARQGAALNSAISTVNDAVTALNTRGTTQDVSSDVNVTSTKGTISQKSAYRTGNVVSLAFVFTSTTTIAANAGLGISAIFASGALRPVNRQPGASNSTSMDAINIDPTETGANLNIMNTAQVSSGGSFWVCFTYVCTGV